MRCEGVISSVIRAFVSCVCVCRCDADPVALAKYVVALLRKDKPKAALKELCIDQLEVFLAKGELALPQYTCKGIVRVYTYTCGTLVVSLSVSTTTRNTT